MKPLEISNSKKPSPSLGRREEREEGELAWRDQLLEARTSGGSMQWKQESQWDLAVLEILFKAEEEDSGLSLCLPFRLLSLPFTEQTQWGFYCGCCLSAVAVLCLFSLRSSSQPSFSLCWISGTDKAWETKPAGASSWDLVRGGGELRTGWDGQEGQGHYTRESIPTGESVLGCFFSNSSACYFLPAFRIQFNVFWKSCLLTLLIWGPPLLCSHDVLGTLLLGHGSHQIVIDSLLLYLSLSAPNLLGGQDHFLLILLSSVPSMPLQEKVNKHMKKCLNLVNRVV